LLLRLKSPISRGNPRPDLKQPPRSAFSGRVKSANCQLAARECALFVAIQGGELFAHVGKNRPEVLRSFGERVGRLRPVPSVPWREAVRVHVVCDPDRFPVRRCGGQLLAFRHRRLILQFRARALSIRRTALDLRKLARSIRGEAPFHVSSSLIAKPAERTGHCLLQNFQASNG